MALTRKLLKGMGLTDEQVPNCPFVLFVGTKSWLSAGSLKRASAVQWQFEGKFTIEKRKPLCYNYKIYRTSSHSEKGASEWVKVYETKNAARISVGEWTVFGTVSAVQVPKTLEK